MKSWHFMAWALLMVLNAFTSDFRARVFMYLLLTSGLLLVVVIDLQHKRSSR